MSIRNVLLFAAIAGAFVVLVRILEGKANAAPEDVPVTHLVEETLHQHAGEDNPIVHAFEAALEQKGGAAAA